MLNFGLPQMDLNNLRTAHSLRADWHFLGVRVGTTAYVSPWKSRFLADWETYTPQFHPAESVDLEA